MSEHEHARGGGLDGAHLRLLSTLRPGSGRVRSSHMLARAISTPQRTIGFMVSRLRQHGHLIGSIHGEGYYLIKTQEELDATLEHIERRKAGIDKTLQALCVAWEQAKETT